jgi:predicted transcriptional regulator
MAAKARAKSKRVAQSDRALSKGPVERLHERIVAGDRGWFFAQIADKVAEQRTAKNLSQRELAELCGTTQSAIARLERGGRPPRIDTLLRIAEALDCELVVELEPRS